MSLQLLTIIDPRDNLEKARRPELVAYARANGLPDISEAMPAILIRKKLRNAGLTTIRIPERILGQPTALHQSTAITDDGEVLASGNGHAIDADDDLARQFDTTAPKNPHTMAYNELRRTARRMGVKLVRKDNLASIKAKVAAAMSKGAANGEDPPQRG